MHNTFNSNYVCPSAPVTKALKAENLIVKLEVSFL